MKHGIAIIGTDTGVGKTVVTAGLAMALRARGIRVGVMKPVASGCRKEGDELISDDAVFLMKAAKDQLAPLTSPVRLKEPLAPSVAAEIEEREVPIEKIICAYHELKKKYEYVIVEGVGGLLVPLTNTYYIADLVKSLHLSVIVVGRISLGTINHTLLTIEALRSRHIEIEGVILNGLNPHSVSVAEQTNPKVIEALGDVRILGVLPQIDMLSVEECTFGNLEEVFQKNINIDHLFT